MPKKTYVVDLTAEERVTLEPLLRCGKEGARKLPRTRVLLQAEEGLTDDEIATGLGVGRATVERTRQRFVAESLGALEEPPRPGGQHKLSGKQEAHLLAVACPPAPSGQTPWTLQWLADKVVELGFAPAIARETVRQGLKKTHSSPGRTSRGVCRR